MDDKFFADIVMSGRIFDLRVGDGISEFDSRLRFGCIEESYGRKESRMLRRDYGLFEATFIAGPSWRCSNLIIEVHRLASTVGLVDEVRRLEGLSLPQYVVWMKVQRSIQEEGKGALLRGLERVGSTARYGVVETGVVVDVLDDGTARADSPGSGDIWSISLTGVSGAVR
jgi:hypothetical protein